jgi:hypothetical protein
LLSTAYLLLDLNINTLISLQIFLVQIMSSTNEHKQRNPAPAHPAKDNAVLFGDRSLYERIEKIADGHEGKQMIDEFEIPIRSAKAWTVKKGMRFSARDF